MDPTKLPTVPTAVVLPRIGARVMIGRFAARMPATVAEFALHRRSPLIRVVPDESLPWRSYAVRPDEPVYFHLSPSGVWRQVGKTQSGQFIQVYNCRLIAPVPMP